MKIRDRLTRGVTTSGPVRSRGSGEGAEKVARQSASSDLVMISERGADIQKARSLAFQAPEIRQEMVDEIVGMMARGEYQVSGADVAPKMIREHMDLAME
jgi:flagellar biosynthesis anti-sigma factor FlgM